MGTEGAAAPARAASLRFRDLPLDTAASADYVVSEAVFRGFISTFGDQSPIHVDDGFAQRAGFGEKVMHGTILNGFLSHFVGMRFPGEHGLLHSVNVRYANPCFLGDRIEIEARVVQTIESVRTIVLSVIARNRTRDNVAARATVQVGLRE